MAGISVRFLGSGDAFCPSGRHQAGYLVQREGAAMLLDCGSTSLASLKRDGIRVGSIDAIAISHLHGDHFAGLPFLLLESTYAEPRSRPLRIAGPPGTEERVRTLYRAMYADAATQPLPFPLEFVQLLPGRLADLGEFELFPFRVPHQEKEISLGLRVAIDGVSVLYSGDTGWTEDLVRESEGTDLFICECSYFETRMAIHLDYPRLEENRHRFGTRRLVLTHLGSEVLARRGDLEIETARDSLAIAVRP